MRHPRNTETHERLVYFTNISDAISRLCPKVSPLTPRVGESVRRDGKYFLKIKIYRSTRYPPPDLPLFLFGLIDMMVLI